MAKSDWSILKFALSNDAPVDLVVTEKAGRGLIATRKISANELIFEETPLVVGPSQKIGSCAPKPLEKYLFCSGCSNSLSPISARGKLLKNKTIKLFYLMGLSFRIV